MHYIDHISATSHDQFFRCGHQWYLVKMEGHKIPPGIAAVIGSSAHEAFELNFKSKLTTHEDLPLSDLEDCAATSYRKRLDDQGVFIAQDDLPSAQKDLAKGKDMCVAVCKPFRADFCPGVQPALIEQKITLEVEGLPSIIGYPDLYTVDKRLSDSKTTARKWSTQQAETATQPTLYREMIKSELGEYPRIMTIDQFVKRKEPAYECAEVTRTPDDFKILLMRFKLMVEQINSGRFLPAIPGSWWCSPRFCGLWWICDFIPAHKKILPKRGA